ncbi:RNA polymerase sigma factor [Paraglaciecola sp. L1A13]|uniref:RNA polymerase sigma factor n=1 Tax=Paraglaciecola sp. L1A13 TaxID=2686359 RepID=UPI00131BB066|nr:RNA polymerase sigma factor [Paraglaciecola sp. L1A13]
MQEDVLRKKSILSVFSECKSSLANVVRRYVKKEYELEDILQEAFVKTFVADKQKQIKFPKLYLFKTTKNLAIRENTKISTRITEYIEDSGESLLISKEQDAFAHLSKQQEKALLLAALNSLPKQCQEVTRLRLLDGVRIKDIALQLNIAVSTTEKHIAKGLERCDDYITKQQQIGPTKTSDIEPNMNNRKSK